MHVIGLDLQDQDRSFQLGHFLVDEFPQARSDSVHENGSPELRTPDEVIANVIDTAGMSSVAHSSLKYSTFVLPGQIQGRRLPLTNPL